METIQDFFNAVKFGDDGAVKNFLENQPALVHRKVDGATALHYAALEGHRNVIDVLLEFGADLESRDDKFNATPIGWANEKGHPPIVQYLSERGAKVDLNRAAAFGMIDLVQEYLAESTEQINTVGGFGTPLHEAALWGHPEIVELLLQSGADPAIENVDGKTAVQIARRQIETGARDTPLVGPSRRREIENGCAKVLEVFRKRGIMR